MASYRYPNIEWSPKRLPTESPQPDPITRYVRTNFIGAGVANFAQPPSQDPEMMTQLTNVMPIVDGSCRRRFGYSLWANPGIAPTEQLYDYQSDITGNRQVVLTDSTFVRAQNDDGSNWNTNIFVPQVQATAPRAAVSRSYTYFSDGLQGDYLKWDGAAVGGTTNWGISLTSQTGPSGAGTAVDAGGTGPTGSQGPSPLTSVTTVDQNQPSSASWPWDSPGNLITNPSTGTTATVTNYTSIGHQTTTGETQQLNVTGFGFSVPLGATITGVQATVTEQQAGATSFLSDNVISLILAGSLQGSNLANNAVPWPTYQSDQVYGGTGNTWGLTLAPSDVNDPGFGLSITAYIFEGPPPDVTAFATVYAVQLTVYYTLPAVDTWTNINNILLDDGNVATSPTTTTLTSILRATNFGFSISNALAIVGIEVDVKCSFTGVQPILQATLLKAGVEYGETKTARVSSSTLAFLPLGGGGDLWQGVWTDADVADTGFGVDIQVQTLAGSGTINIDYLQLTVFTEVGPITLGSPVSGNITLINGRIYYAVFENSSAGNYSDLNVVSASTGPLTAQNQPLSTIPVSSDPQVDRVNILATADGGDETRLYLVANIANGITTYTDSMDEPTLLNQPVLLSTDTTGNEYGVTNNDPPPVGGIYPIQHRGRIYLVKGPTLYWSKSLVEVTTDTSFIAGRWEEDWPPANSLDISEGAESVRGMLTDGVNLYLGTEFKIRRLNGDAPFLEPPDIVHNQVGILNQDVWKITFLEGTPVGAMWLTPDSRVIGSDFNTYTDVGTNIQTTLNTINLVAAITTARASFYSSGPYDLFLLAIPTGVSTVNDTVCVYNLRTQMWVIWSLTDTLVSLLFQITAQGAPQLLLSTASGKLYNYNTTTYQDRTNDAPATPQVVLQTSWLDLQDPALRKMLNEIEVQTGDIGLLVTVEGASSVLDFASPHIVVTNQPIELSPRGEYKAYLSTATSLDRYYRFTFTSNNLVPVVLGGYNIENVPVNRQ